MLAEIISQMLLANPLKARPLLHPRYGGVSSDPARLSDSLRIGTIFLALWYALVRVCDPKI